MNTKHENILWFILLLSATTLLVFRPLYSGEFTLHGEAADLFIPVFSHMREALLHGEWPLWNKYQYQGIDSAMLPVYWNPVCLLVACIYYSPDLSVNALYLFLLFISGIGFYKFCGLNVEDARTAILGGICYPLTGFFVIQSQDIGLIATAAWIPLLLYESIQYQKVGKYHHLILLATGYFLFATMTSQNYVWLGTSLIIIQATYQFLAKGFGYKKLLFISGSILAAGFLVWRIYWERWNLWTPSPEFQPAETGFLRIISELVSFILPKATAVPATIWGIEGPVHFHFYVGIIVLFMAVYGIWFSGTYRDKLWGWLCVIFFILSLVFSAVETMAMDFSALGGSPLNQGFKIFLSGSVLVLGLRGLEKIRANPARGRVFFLAIPLILAALALYISKKPGDSDLTLWFIRFDVWKSALFLTLTWIFLWFRNHQVTFLLIGSLIILDLGLTNYLNQDSNLYNKFPSSSFSEYISYPAKRTAPVDLDHPVGGYTDHDFQIASLDQNTGSLVKKIVRDGYWPSIPEIPNQDSISVMLKKQLRYPLFYYSKDTSWLAAPSYTNYDDPIAIITQDDHLWKLSIMPLYEKYLVFNQNYDKNWAAKLDGLIIPTIRTSAGMMKIPIIPGLHTVTFEYQTNGLIHIFGVMMVIFLGLILYLIKKKTFPVPVLIAGFPLLMIYVLNPGGKFAEMAETSSMPDSADYVMSYENHAPFWFVRSGQVTPFDSFNGYRSEALNEEAVYSATLQIHRNALRGKTELEYRFHIKASQSIETGVVLKTYSNGDESYNIDYITSLNSDDWTTIEGSFPLLGLSGPLIKAEFYIWNHKKQDFLIDDIEIKLNP